MGFGSFIAGATTEGGGAVAFPVLTLLFEIPPEVIIRSKDERFLFNFFFCMLKIVFDQT